jgi:hypothetical protein
MSITANEPAQKWPKYVGCTLADKVWLLDFSKNNPCLSYEELGKVLAADFTQKSKTNVTLAPVKKAQLLVGRKKKRNCARRTMIKQQGER